MGEDCSLKFYLREIGKYPLLGKEEEINLAKRKDKGDLRAREKLINSNLRLVVNIAKRYTERGSELLDLIQGGNVGLVEGVDQFDYKKNIRLSTYSKFWIKKEILSTIVDNYSNVVIPSRRYFQIPEILRKYNDDSSIEKISQDLKTKLEIIYGIIVSSEMISFDESISDDATILDMYGDTRYSSDKSIDSLRWDFEKILSKYPSKKADVISMSFGLNGDTNHEQKEIASKYGITTDRVKDIKREVLDSLRGSSHAKELEYLVHGD